MRRLPLLLITLWPVVAHADLHERMPPVELPSIRCDQIKTFHNLRDATEYAKTKGYMVIHEQGKKIWRTMPNTTEVLVGGCYEED